MNKNYDFRRQELIGYWGVISPPVTRNARIERENAQEADKLSVATLIQYEELHRGEK